MVSGGVVQKFPAPPIVQVPPPIGIRPFYPSRDSLPFMSSHLFGPRGAPASPGPVSSEDHVASSPDSSPQKSASSVALGTKLGGQGSEEFDVFLESSSSGGTGTRTSATNTPPAQNPCNMGSVLGEYWASFGSAILGHLYSCRVVVGLVVFVGHILVAIWREEPTPHTCLFCRGHFHLSW